MSYKISVKQYILCILILAQNIQTSYSEDMKCPDDIEESFVAAYKSCVEEMPKMGAKPLSKVPTFEEKFSLNGESIEDRFRRGLNLSLLNKREILGTNLSLLRESPNEEYHLDSAAEDRFRRGLNLSLLNKRALLDDIRFRRELLGLNLSLLREAAREEYQLEDRFRRSLNVSLLNKRALAEERFRRELLGLNLSLLREAAKEEYNLAEPEERFRRSLNVSLLNKRATEERFRRGLLETNLSLLRESPEESYHVEATSETSREKREENMNIRKEVGEALVCAIEKLIKEEPVIQKSILECAKTHDTESTDSESQKKFEKCVEEKIKQMCPNTKMN